MSVVEAPAPGTSSRDGPGSSESPGSSHQSTPEATDDSRGVAGADEDGTPESDTLSARFQKTSLLEWMQLIQFERLDAVVIVRPEGGTKGCLWCIGGEIVDARADTLTGEDAVYQLLALRGGEFSVAFGGVDRPRVITSPTGAMLVEAKRRKAPRGSKDDALARSAQTSSTPPVILVSVSHLASHPPREEQTLPNGPPARHSRTSLRHLGAGLALAAVIAASWQLAAPPPPREEATGSQAGTGQGSSSTRVSSTKDLLVNVDVEPNDAEIWLDGERAGAGHLSQLLMRDHRTHDIRFVAPGYVAQSIIFRESSPPRRVMLERVERPSNDVISNLPSGALLNDDDPSSAMAEQAEVVPEKRQRAHIERGRPRRSLTIALPVPERHRPLAAKENASPPPSDPLPAKPRIQVIDELGTPRPKVQIVDEAMLAKPKVQIIESNAPQVKVID